MTAAPVDGSVETPPFHERLPLVPSPPVESSLPGDGGETPSGSGYGVNEGDTAAGRTPAGDAFDGDGVADDGADALAAGACVTDAVCAVTPAGSAARASGPRKLWRVATHVKTARGRERRKQLYRPMRFPPKFSTS